MIVRLVIGDIGDPQEVFVSGDMCPQAVKLRVRALYHDKAEIVGTTWSPVVLDEVVRLARRQRAGVRSDPAS